MQIQAQTAQKFTRCAILHKKREPCTDRAETVQALAEQTKKPQDLSVLRHFLVRWKGLKPPAY